MADAARGEIGGRRTADSTDTDQQRRSAANILLTVRTDLRQGQVACVAIQRACRHPDSASFRLVVDRDFEDGYGFNRDVRMTAAIARRYGGDRVDDVEALRNLSKNRVAEVPCAVI